MKFTGVTARGIVMPIFKSGDPLIDLICEQTIKAAQSEGFSLNDRDILAVTESVVARAQGNYATCAQIAKDVRSKFPEPVLGVLFPIISRNRIAIILKAIAQGVDKVIIQLSYPTDEVGNELVAWDKLDDHKINPYTHSFDEEEFRSLFGVNVHRYTGVDYVAYYKSLGSNIEIVFSNDPCHLLNYTDQILCCDVHTRKRSQRLLLKAQARTVLCLDQLMTASVDGSGYNPQYGLLGANKATEDMVKFFPRDGQSFVDQLQLRLLERTGKRLEVLIYGDGGFKDPQVGIWELHDPVISPAFTSGLHGVPNELKLKFIVDDELDNLRGEELENALRERIKAKPESLYGQMAGEGTTPRQLTDLLGSLSDLISGSGDRGTPVVLIQGYFTNYASE
ncbi:MAG: coenzyme F420-0:L-glutamate ligase [Symbiobacteriaceae bacterium]|nr:coenzyme F420-0:L-glutamate ligase [Symbiobacteriaceae bacterium]